MVLGVLGISGALGGAEAASTYPCFGDPRGGTLYPEPRIFLEAQAWWNPTPGNNETSHLHVGTCFPLGQRIAGVVRFDVRSVMHNSPGRMTTVEMGFNPGGPPDVISVPVNLTCPGDHATCEVWTVFDMDTNTGPNGLQEFRFKPRITEINGDVQLPSNGWRACVANDGRSCAGVGAGTVVARGWYSGHGYQNPVLNNPTSIFAFETGAVALSGEWTPSVTLGPGSGGNSATGHLVTIDPNMHAGNEGNVQRQGPGGLSGTVPIDTSTLSNGVHRLFLRVDAEKNGETNSGVLVVPFLVNNAVLPPPPPPAPTGLAATAGDHQVALTWSAAAGADSYRVHRSTTAGGPYTLRGETIATGYLDTTALNDVTYYYAVSAVNAGGEGPMSSEVSATPALTPPGTVTGLVATAGALRVELSWIPVANAESYRVYRGTSSGAQDPTPIATDLTSVSYVDIGLTPGTTYYYLVTAVNALGESPPSAEVSATPTPPPPDAPTGLTATALGTSIDLAWDAVGGADSYRVYRATSSGGQGPVPIATDLASAAYNDTGLTRGTTYFYVVRAVGQGIEGSASNEASATTIPPAPAWLAASAGDNQVDLSWGSADGADEYQVRRSTLSGGPYELLDTSATASYTDTTAANGTTFYYTVTAVNAAGESDPSAEISATPLPPPPGAPIDLAAVATGIDVALSWSPVIGADSYRVYRAAGAGSYGTTPIASDLTDTSYVDAGLATGTTYRYHVRAVGPGGEGAASNEASAMTVPDPPSGVVATAGDGQIGLSWSASPGAEAYAVSRADAAGGPYSGIATLTGTSHVDTGLTNGTTYYYTVSAGNAAGESASSAVSATPAVPPPPAPAGLTATGSGTQISLSWSPVGAADAYNVYRGTSSGGPFAPLTSGLTATSHVDAGLGTAQTYHYVVTAVDRGVEGPQSTQASATTVPPAPGGLVAVAGNGQVSLSWSAAPAATSYRVKRGTTPGGPYAQLATMTSPSYIDTAAANGTTYFYVASAVNAAGESPASNEASATPLASPPTTLTFAADHDTYVKQSSPTTAFGVTDPSRLQVRSGSNSVYSYLKFQVAGLSGVPSAARLRLCVTDPSPNAGPVRRASNFRSNGSTPWTEGTLTWNTRPATIGGNLSAVGAVSTGSCYEWDVKAAITGNGTFSFVLLGGSTDHAHFGSAESSSPPQLIVTQ